MKDDDEEIVDEAGRVDGGEIECKRVGAFWFTITGVIDRQCSLVIDVDCYEFYIALVGTIIIV